MRAQMKLVFSKFLNDLGIQLSDLFRYVISGSVFLVVYYWGGRGIFQMKLIEFSCSSQASSSVQQSISSIGVWFTWP